MTTHPAGHGGKAPDGSQRAAPPNVDSAFDRLSVAVLDMTTERDRLKAINGELLAALELTANVLEAVNVQLKSWGKQSAFNTEKILADARAAISRATGDAT